MGQIIRLTRKLEQELWQNVDHDVGDLDRCWPWKGGTFEDVLGWEGQGYGCGPDGYPAHRLAYVSHYGVQPGRKYVCHKCDNPRCCNPHHLFLGTPLDNSRDMVQKGRQRVPTSSRRVTEDERQTIKKSSLTNRQLSRRIGFAVRTIAKHRNG